MSTTPLRRLLPLTCLSLTLLPALVRADDASVTLNLIPLPNTRHQQDFRIKAITDMKFKAREGASEEEVQQLSAKLGAFKMPLTMSMQMRQVLQTSKADAKGRIPLTARIERGTMEMRTGDGDLLPGVPQRGMPAMQFSADIVGGRYENIRLSGEGATQLPPDMLEDVFRKTFDALAEMNGATLRVGESVEMPLGMNLPIPNLPAGSNVGKMTASYTLTKVDAGMAFFDVKATMDLKLDLPMPAAPASAPEGAAPAAPASLQMVIGGGGAGHMQLRLADRLQLHNDLDLQMALQIPLPQGHTLQMTLQMQVDSDGKSLPAAKGKPGTPPAKAASTR